VSWTDPGGLSPDRGIPGPTRVTLWNTRPAYGSVPSFYCSRGDTVCARVLPKHMEYRTANGLRRTVHIECGEDVASQRGGEARDAASSGLGRIRNGHAHGLNDPRARLHGDEGRVWLCASEQCIISDVPIRPRPHISTVCRTTRLIISIISSQHHRRITQRTYRCSSHAILDTLNRLWWVRAGPRGCASGAGRAL
jgi:hypothetical protein